MYKPAPPTAVEQLPRYLEGELRKISESFEAVDTNSVRFKVFHVEPDKPRQGQLYFADGTNWNPGSGEGLYVRLAGGWSKL